MLTPTSQDPHQATLRPLMHNAPPVNLSVRVLPTEMMQWDIVCDIEKLEQVFN
jgi:hypothetical protein